MAKEALIALRERVRYGAAELKRVYNRNLGLALAVSILAHLLLIGVYLSVTERGTATTRNADGAIDSISLKDYTHIKSREPKGAVGPQTPPAPSFSAARTAAPIGNMVPVADNILPKDTFKTASVSVSATSPMIGGSGPSVAGTDTGSGPAAQSTMGTPPQVVDRDKEPILGEFMENVTEPDVNLADIQKNVIYPEIARKNNVEGTVNVAVLLDIDGTPLKTRINSSDNRLLEQAATDAIMKTRFSAASQNGHPVKIWMSIPVRFQLERGR